MARCSTAFPGSTTCLIDTLTKGIFVKKNYIARRRGTSVAAAALSFALVAPFAQPVTAPQFAAKANAAETSDPDVQAPDEPTDGGSALELHPLANGQGDRYHRLRA